MFIEDGAAQYRRLLAKTSTARISTDDRHSLSVVDWNRDGRLDLVVSAPQLNRRWWASKDGGRKA